MPTDTELRLSEDAYLMHATGIAMLRDPDNEVNMAINSNEAVHVDPEAIVLRAEVLIFEGLRQVVRFANPKNLRTNLLKLEPRFREALPYMIDTVDRVVQTRTEELIRLDSAFDYIAPKAMANETVYKHLCHHTEKLFTNRLCGGLVPAPVFEQILQGRTLAHLAGSTYLST